MKDFVGYEMPVCDAWILKVVHQAPSLYWSENWQDAQLLVEISVVAARNKNTA